LDLDGPVVRLHDALGDGKAEPATLCAAKLQCTHVFTFYKFLKYVRQLLPGYTWPIVGNTQRNTARPRNRIQNHFRFGRRVNDSIPHHIADGLLRQSGVGAHQRKIGRQVDFDRLLRSTPARGVDDAFGHFPEIYPIAAQLQSSRIDAGDGKKIADHFVEIFSLSLDLSEQILLRSSIELVAIVDEARGRPEDR